MVRALESKVKRLKEEREKSLSAVSGETTPASEEEQEEAMNESPEEAGGENGVSGADGHAAVEDEDEPDAGAVKEEEENASGESVAAPKEADAEEKESSDVQSSASPSKRRLRKVGGEALSSSASAPLPAAEAEPLLAFLESVRASKSGSVFERRLESQVKDKNPFSFLYPLSERPSAILHLPPYPHFPYRTPSKCLITLINKLSNKCLDTPVS